MQRAVPAAAYFPAEQTLQLTEPMSEAKWPAMQGRQELQGGDPVCTDDVPLGQSSHWWFGPMKVPLAHTSVGDRVGAGMGTIVGDGNGTPEGAGMGALVGAGTGTSVGAGMVGAGTGTSVGAGTGTSVGAGMVGAGTGTSVVRAPPGVGAGMVGAGTGVGRGNEHERWCGNGRCGNGHERWRLAFDESCGSP